jgi:PIN domain nuclease of toxin-antitoxin system
MIANGGSKSDATHCRSKNRIEWDDRLLIAQANVEDATLVSADTIFPQDPVKLLW